MYIYIYIYMYIRCALSLAMSSADFPCCPNARRLSLIVTKGIQSRKARSVAQDVQCQAVSRYRRGYLEESQNQRVPGSTGIPFGRVRGFRSL